MVLQTAITVFVLDYKRFKDEVNRATKVWDGEEAADAAYEALFAPACVTKQVQEHEELHGANCKRNSKAAENDCVHEGEDDICLAWLRV